MHEAITKIKPDSVIHSATWTDVDATEDEKNKPKVYAINFNGTRHIAEACKEIDCRIVYFSTDYVFDGQWMEPWQPDCKDYKPLNYCGQTMFESELAVSGVLDKYFIVRVV